MTARKLLNALVKSNYLKEIRLDFPFRKELRYSTQELPLLKGLHLMFPDAYYCHQTAAIFHGFLKVEQSKIYLNIEQNLKSNTSGSLDQASIHRAFKNKPRITTNKINYEGHEIYVLNGKNTEKLGVSRIELPSIGTINTTTPERTLIDMVVRPFYSGGSKEVLNAFRNAHNKISLVKLKSLYNKLNYIYPYQQAIGFYFEASGNYAPEDIKIFEKKRFKFDFYLSNAMKNSTYSKRWRIYYPDDLLDSKDSQND
jgi:predicted transcriptional regulator of viral defense system